MSLFYLLVVLLFPARSYFLHLPCDHFVPAHPFCSLCRTSRPFHSLSASKMVGLKAVTLCAFAGVTLQSCNSLRVPDWENFKPFHELSDKERTELGEKMSEPVTFEYFDRIGFVRGRKVASTATHIWLMKNNFCYRDCDFTTCLYARDCEIPFKCPPPGKATYPCMHYPAINIVQKFQMENLAWERSGRLTELDQQVRNNAKLLLMSVPLNEEYLQPLTASFSNCFFILQVCAA